mmetsp:Transcript_40020/g.102365  ORF Transcript_40020/g.102365 Transcript_40020/m.102365 type:complete len:288 (+) Transcript_40020:370-1233(+)
MLGWPDFQLECPSSGAAPPSEVRDEARVVEPRKRREGWRICCSRWTSSGVPGSAPSPPATESRIAPQPAASAASPGVDLARAIGSVATTPSVKARLRRVLPPVALMLCMRSFCRVACRATRCSMPPSSAPVALERPAISASAVVLSVRCCTSHNISSTRSPSMSSTASCASSSAVRLLTNSRGSCFSGRNAPTGSVSQPLAAQCSSSVSASSSRDSAARRRLERSDSRLAMGDLPPPWALCPPVPGWARASAWRQAATPRRLCRSCLTSVSMLGIPSGPLDRSCLAR